MRIHITIGDGGWVRVDQSTQPGPLLAHFEADPHDGRLSITQLVVTGRGQRLTTTMLRGLPLDTVEALVNAPEYAESLRHRMDMPCPDLKAAFPALGSARVPRYPDPAPLNAPTGGLTGDHLRHVAAAYTAALRAGSRAPAHDLAAQATVPVRTIHRWIALARARGIMPPGRRGHRG